MRALMLRLGVVALALALASCGATAAADAGALDCRDCLDPRCEGCSCQNFLNGCELFATCRAGQCERTLRDCSQPTEPCRGPGVCVAVLHAFCDSPPLDAGTPCVTADGGTGTCSAAAACER